MCLQYVVLKVKDRGSFNIAHLSSSASDLLRPSRAQGTAERITNEDIFKVLAERSPSSSTVMKSYKKTVTDFLGQGKSVSVDMEIAIEDIARIAPPTRPAVKTEKRLVSHWTPCKDEEGRVKYVVLILAETREL